MAVASLLFFSLLALGGAELALRWLPIQNRHLHFGEPSVYRYDADLIYAIRSGADGANSLGLRDHEFGPKGERIRILALGDSFTYGHGVARNSAYPQSLERILNRKAPDRDSDREYEVVNAGVPGYNVDQAFALLPRLLPLDPDWVILVIEPKDLGGSNVLYTIERGRLEKVAAWRNWIYLQLWLRTNAPRIVQNTSLYRFLLGRLTGSDPIRTLPSIDRDAIVDWQIDKIDLMLGDLLAMSRTHGFELLVVNYPDRSAVEHHGDYRHGTYFRGSPVQVLGADANRHMERLRRTIRDSGARSVDALDAFVEKVGSGADINSLYLLGDSHMNRSGNRLLAEVVAKRIAQHRR